ncbi:hypothetical protein BBJ28_00025447 [Nothophytophthora sp. Chile5]|nr:hypothetical protein BBJ28_00025447 [Nothophytophthora sp. Chile5]
MIRVAQLIREDQCGHCLRGKAAALEMVVAHVRRLTRAEKRESIFTALTILYVAEDAQPRRTRSTGERVRFHYYLPFVGRVCKSAFLSAYSVSAPTVARYRRLIREGRVLGECEPEL